MSIEAMKPLPCPFCGGTHISTHEGTSFRWQVAECMTCGAQGSEVRRQTTGQGTTDLWIKQASVDAIMEWNTRVAPPQREWQGLTDEERSYLAWESNNGLHCVTMTEAKLKGKNA
jgi:Lar family restriction alleviation protein